MKTSERGAAFTARWEGFVSTAYRCPAGVLTIGHGFTMRSAVFSRYWQSKYGRGLQRGDRVARDEAATLLPLVMDEEYGAAVNARIKPKAQHHYDAATDMAFNCGAGALGWKWGRALADGDFRLSAKLIKKTAITGGGRRLPGLARRRTAESRLIENADYGSASHGYPTFAPAKQAVVVADDILKNYQAKLKRLGFDPGPLDGRRGPKTTAAVKRFQTANPPLVVDGILGRATMAAIDRLADAKKRLAGAGGVTGAGAVVSTTPVGQAAAADPVIGWAMIAGGAVLIAGLAYLAWFYRDEIRNFLRRGNRP